MPLLTTQKVEVGATAAAKDVVVSTSFCSDKPTVGLSSHEDLVKSFKHLPQQSLPRQQPP
jgi:hypothetical protein